MTKAGRRKKVKQVAPPQSAAGGLWFAPPQPPEPTAEEKKAQRAKERAERPRPKNNPKLIAAARELRDRYLEQINAGLLLPPAASGKYDVSRALPASGFTTEAADAAEETKLLNAA